MQLPCSVSAVAPSVADLNFRRMPKSLLGRICCSVINCIGLSVAQTTLPNHSSSSPPGAVHLIAESSPGNVRRSHSQILLLAAASNF
jgi:hypothetical protein